MNKLFFTLFCIFLSFKAFAEVNITLPQNLKLNGDIKAKWKSEWESDCKNSLKIESNLEAEYNLSDAWFNIKMKAATSDSNGTNIDLDKAFVGYHLYKNSQNKLIVEIGRNKMDSMFDSKIQFDSFFNGMHLHYKYSPSNLFQFTLHGGPHLINSDKNQYGWITEGIWSHIACNPITLKYSITFWNAPNLVNSNFSNSLEDEKNHHFAISQMTIAYDIIHTTIYGAYLINHLENNFNDGFYLGFTVGKIRKKGDFTFDLNFQSSKNRLTTALDLKGFKKGVQAKVVYALSIPLNLEAKLSLFDDHDNKNNKRLEMNAVYSW